VVQLANDSLVLELGIVAKVDEEAEAEAGGLEVIMDLGAVPVGELGNGLDFEDDLVETDEVGLVGLLQEPSLIPQLQISLRVERDPAHPQLQFQALVVDGFEKASPLLVVHFKARSHDPIALVRIDDLHPRPSSFV
jgi:hypothetical protein